MEDLRPVEVTMPADAPPANELVLLLVVTGHGIGHLSQCAPVIAALRRMRSLKLFVHSGLPADRLSAWLGPIEALLPTDDEFGAVMIDAATIDRSATIARYRALHARLPRAIGALADTIRDRRCGVVLSNMSYIATAAAAAAGVPSVAFCSLAWHEIAAACFADPPELPREMLACYLQATCVLRLQPGTPFAGLPSTAVARPIARVGRARRDELAAWLHIDPARPIALLSFSVLPARVPPLLAAPHDFALVGPAEWRDYGVAVIEDAPLPYPDLLASVDVVVSKAGYGTAAEVCCASIPAVLLDRPDWPEQRYVVDWLHAHGRCLMVPSIQAVTAAALRAGMALPLPATPLPIPGGETEVAAAVLAVAGGLWPKAPDKRPP